MNSGAKQHNENPCFNHFSNLEKIKEVFNFQIPRIKILDLGCGDGRLSSELVQQGHEVWGLDSTEDGLLVAQKRGLQTIKADLEEKLPLNKESFDLVLILDVLEHLGAQEKIIAEAKRVTKPNGSIIIAYPNHFDLRNRINMLFGGGIIHWDHKKYENAKAWQYGHIRFLLYTELLALLEKNNLYPAITQFNFMAGGLIPTKLTPSFFRRFLLQSWPQLFTGKYVIRVTKEKSRENKYIYIPRTVRGM